MLVSVKFVHAGETWMLTSGAGVIVPVDQLPWLAGATDAQLAEVELSPVGAGLGWPSLDREGGRILRGEQEAARRYTAEEIRAALAWITARRRVRAGEAPTVVSPAATSRPGDGEPDPVQACA